MSNPRHRPLFSTRRTTSMSVRWLPELDRTGSTPNLASPGSKGQVTRSALSVAEMEVPAHWTMPKGRTFAIPFQVLCLIAHGKASLEEVWVECREETSFIRMKERMIDRITSITVMAGLVLSSTAAFLTTTPPLGGIVDFNSRSSYILIVISFGLTLGSLIAGSAAVYVLYEAQHRWFLNVIMGDRFNACCALMIMGYPFLSIGISTMLLALGLIVAIWSAGDNALKIGGLFMVIAPATLIPLFIAIHFRGKYIKATVGLGVDDERTINMSEEPKPIENAQCGCCCYQRGKNEREQGSYSLVID